MPLTRFENMARIRATGTGPELLLRQALQAASLTCTEQTDTPGGRADFVFPDVPLAVFIDGCFWHGRPEHYVRPRSREEFWSCKLTGNLERDRRQTLALEAAGWRVLRMWECESADAAAAVERVFRALRPGSPEPEHCWRVERVKTLDAETGMERRFLVDLRNGERFRMVDVKRPTRKRGRVLPEVSG